MYNFSLYNIKIIFSQLILLIQLSSSMIVFPFSIIKENKNDKINSDDFSYNYKNYFNNYFTQLIYINISIGKPYHEIKMILTYQDCDFKIKNVSECIKYKDKEELNINVFSDINLKNIFSCENVNYSSFNNKFDININLYDYIDLYCGVLGLRSDKFNKKCNINNNLIHNLYSKGYINNNEWLLKYTSNEKGLIIFGTDNLKDLIPKFNQNNIYKTNAIIKETNYNWAFYIEKIICINNTKDNENITYTISKERIEAEINNDFSFIQGSYSYYDFIEKNYFKDYLKKKICTKYIWYKDKYFQYFVFECDKNSFNEKDLINFPKLYFYSFNGNIKFEFDYKDLFTETKYKYFFNIIFSIYNVNNWVLGKLFLKKYLIIINSEEKLIKFYLSNNTDTNNDIEIKKNIDKNGEKIFKQIIVIILFISFGFLCFYFGRKFRRERRKKANELIDEYVYDSNIEKKNNEENGKKLINYKNY